MDNIDKVGSLRRTQKDYSLAFKLQVVDEVEKGFLTYKQSQRKYGIQGRSTVLKWLRKHGQLNWDSDMTKKNSPFNEIQELKAKIKLLENDKKILNIAIDVANEMFSIDIRKKCLALSSERLKRQSKE